jgi:hypothetical protein
VDVTILYFGDFNPSGYHAPVSILDAMEYYGVTFSRDFPGASEPEYYDPEHGLPQHYTTDGEDVGSLDFERCAINLEHIQRFDLPENPVPSSSDKDSTIKRHFQNYVSGGEDTNVELNALKEYERDFLEDLIRDSIDKHVDGGVERRVRARVEDARDALETAVEIDDSELDDAFDPPISGDDRVR